MNVAVGGNFPGAPNDETQFPAELVVDYVRVYDKVGGYGPRQAARPGRDALAEGPRERAAQLTGRQRPTPETTR